MERGQQPTHFETAEKKTEAPFLNKEWMESLRDRLYAKANPLVHAINGGQVTPESRNCMHVVRPLKQILEEEQIKAEELKYSSPTSRRGVILHAFVTADYDQSPYLIDMQYKQFLLNTVSKEERDTLPDYLAFPYKSKMDLKRELENHRIPEEFHEYWIDALFPKPLSTNLQKRAFSNNPWPKNPNPEDNRRR